MNKQNQLLVDSLGNSQGTERIVPLQLTTMLKTFGDALREQLNERNVSAAALSRRSGVSKQHLSKILNNEQSPMTGAITKPSVGTVDKIARGLGWDQNDARLAAGYASTTSKHTVNGFEIDLPDDIQMVIPYSDNIRSAAEAREFQDAVLLAYEITKHRLAERRKQDDEKK